MRSIAAYIVVAAALVLRVDPASAQGSSPVPAVLFRFDPEYQAIVEGARQGRDPQEDIRWAERRAEGLTDFHSRNGGRLLRLLSDYAGVRWAYREIPVYVVRNFPTLSIEYPLTLAVGAIRQGESRQEIPEGDFLILTVAHQITHYLLDPPPEELAADRPEALEHPLMEEGNYRREALVNLVTYRALEDIWGRERLRKATAEPLWASYNPEAAFIDTVQGSWSLSRSRPLVTWLLQEDDEGRLVRLAERLESARPGTAKAPQAGGGGGEGGGTTLAGNEIGLDLGQTAEGRLFIAFLDRGSPADAAGLRAGDIVVTVEGRSFSSVSEAMRTVRDAWQSNGEVNLSVERQGKEIFFQIH